MILASRRLFLTGLASTLAAPAIVRVESLMPVRGTVLGIDLGLDRGTAIYTVVPDALYAHLVDVTRQAFVPRLFIDIYEKCPLHASYGKAK